MKRIIIFIIIITSLAFTTLMSENNHPVLKLHYTLTITDPESQKAQVKLLVKNYNGKIIKLKFHPFYEGEKVIEPLNIKLKTADSSVSKIIRQGLFYIVQNGSNSDFEVNYEIFINKYRNVPPAPAGYLCGTYLLTTAAWTFLIPDGITADEYSVEFRLPEKWVVACPWRKNGNNYIETNFNRFIEAAFGAGDFEIREKNINGTLARITVDKNFDGKSRTNFIENYFKIFSNIKSIFGASSPDTHLSIIVRSKKDNEWQWNNESCYSQGEAMQNLGSAYYQCSHRIFHTYNAFYPNGMNIEPTWFNEGVNEYFDILMLMDIRYGNPLKELEKKYRENYIINRDKYDAPLKGNTVIPGNWEKTSFLAYSKGALTAFLLDLEIRKKTGNKKSLKDVLKKLYQEYGMNYDKKITDNVISKTVSEIASEDMSGFFGKYIQKNTFLEMNALFSDTDKDGLSNGAEILLGTNPDLADTDGDGVSDYWEYKDGTDPLSAESKIERIVYIDGIDNEWGKLKTKDFSDAKGDSSMPGTDLIQIKTLQKDQILYLMMKFAGDAEKNNLLSYYIHIDTNMDYAAELVFSAAYDRPGDTLKFKKDGSTYDSKQMDEVENLESAVRDVVEFKIPISLFGNTKKLQMSAGVWDTKKNKSLDSTDWMVLEIE